MPAEVRVEDGKALLAAASAAGTAVGTVSLYLLPGVFHPWPAVLAALFLAGIAGAIPGATLADKRHVFPLVLLLLPLYRLGLLILRHGLPPWPVGGWGWLAGDGFPLWLGASVLAAAYAGVLAGCHARIRPRAQLLRHPSPRDPDYYIWLASRVGEEDQAQINYETICRVFLATVAVCAVLSTALGPAAENAVVMVCAAIHLALGLYFVGLAYARRMAAAWAEQGFAVFPDTERRWWTSHGRYVWSLLLIALALPGGFRPVNLGALIASLFNRVPPAAPRPFAGAPGPGPGIRAGLERMGASASAGRIMVAIFAALLLLARIIALILLAFAAFLALRGIFTVLGGWARSLAPLWRAIGRFLSALREILRSTTVLGVEFLRRAGLITQDARDGGRKTARPPAWPSSPVREIFARLALWGRARGFILRPSHTPGEIGRGVASLTPGQEEDIAFLVDGYRRERYGSAGVEPGEITIYRQAWERVTESAPREAGEKREEF